MTDFICSSILGIFMQLSEDGNYMWNGTEWLPVENQPEQPQIAEQPAISTEPVAPEVSTDPIVQPATPVNQLPQVLPQQNLQPVIVTTSPQGMKAAINLSSALSVFKYGIIALGGWIVSMIILTILWGSSFYLAFDSGDALVGLLIIMAALVLTIIAYGQMIIYPVGKALKDGRWDASKFSYVDSWKTSIAGFIESSIVIVLMSVTTAVGLKYDIGALTFLGGFAYFFFLLGYIPYMVRKAAEMIK